MKIRVVIFGTCLIGLASCGHATAHTAAAEPPSPASISPAGPATVAPATAGPWTTSEAATAYLRLAAPTNALLRRWGAEANAGPLGHDVSLAQSIVKAEDTFARGLAAGRWPQSAQSDVRTLYQHILTARAGWQTVAGSASMTAVAAASNAPALNDPATVAAATAVRIDLGLPSN